MMIYGSVYEAILADNRQMRTRIVELERMTEFWKKAALLARDEFVERGDELDRLRQVPDAASASVSLWSYERIRQRAETWEKLWAGQANMPAADYIEAAMCEIRDDYEDAKRVAASVPLWSDKRIGILVAGDIHWPELSTTARRLLIGYMKIVRDSYEARSGASVPLTYDQLISMQEALALAWEGFKARPQSDQTAARMQRLDNWIGEMLTQMRGGE